jgi:hypothetical protein
MKLKSQNTRAAPQMQRVSRGIERRGSNRRAAERILSLATTALLLCATLLFYVQSSGPQPAHAAGAALDGTAHNSVNLASALSVNLSTNGPDVIIILVGINDAGGIATVQGVSSLHLAFHQRATGTGNSMYLEEWYAVGSSALSSESIKVTLTAATRFTIMAFAVSGADTAAIFDGSPSIGPSGCCGVIGGQPYGTTHHTNTFSTSNSNDFILAYDASQGNPGYTATSPLTLGDQVMVGSWMASAWGYSLVTAPQMSQQYLFSTSVGENGVVFVDAIMQSSTSTTTTTSTSSASSTSTSTLLSSSTSSTTSSSTTTTSTTSTTTSTLQAGSNRNYFIMDNGAYLHNVTASMLLTNQLSGVSAGQYGGNWSLQLNAYSPNGYGAAFTQFVISYSNGVMIPDVESYSSTGTFLGMDVLSSSAIPSSALTTGTQVSIAVSTDSTGGVVAASFAVVANNGNVLSTVSASLTNYPYLVAPMVGFELILVGYGGGSQSIVTFTQASGVFQFQSSTPLLWTTTFPGNFSWVQYKANGSSESSNLVYGVPQQQGSNLIAQSFGTTITTTSSTTSTTNTTTRTSTTTTTSSTTSTTGRKHHRP